MNIEIPKSFYDSIKISTFLEVKASDVLIKDAFWHDENDNPIDCNIYHPKYGSITVKNKYGSFDVRLGFLTKEQSPIITSCSYSYKSCETNEIVYCQFNPLSILCIHDDGHFTNKDGKIILKVDYHRTNLTRSAIDNNDFAEIYNREFLNSQLEDKEINHTVFVGALTGHMLNLIKLHEDNRVYGSTLDLPIIAKAREFLEWLKTGKAINSLSAYEIALVYYLLSDAKKIQSLHTPDAANKYSQKYGKSADNIRKSIYEITKLRKEAKPLANKTQFENVRSHLSDYTDVQKGIDNYIAQLI